MKKISLQKVHGVGPNSFHVKMLVNEKDVGILYLKEEELEVLIDCIKKGIYDSDTEFETDIFDDEDDVDGGEFD